MPLHARSKEASKLIPVSLEIQGWLVLKEKVGKVALGPSCTWSTAPTDTQTSGRKQVCASVSCSLSHGAGGEVQCSLYNSSEAASARVHLVISFPGPTSGAFTW